MKRHETTRTEMFNQVREMPLWLLLANAPPFEVAAKRSDGWSLVPEAGEAIAAIQRVWREYKGKAWLLPSRETLAAAIAAHEALPAAIRDRLQSGGDAMPFLDQRGRMVFEAVRAGLFYSDLTAALSAVAECIESNCGADEPIRQAFAQWHRDDLTYAELVAMRAAFLALPEDEQRRILNGWAAASDWPPAHEVVSMTAEADMTVRVLLMTGDGNGQGSSSQCIIKRQSWRAAEVTIREGATKGEAIAAVRAMLERLESQWDELVGGPLDVFIHPEKEPRTAVLIAQMLGGKSEEADAVAAA